MTLKHPRLKKEHLSWNTIDSHCPLVGALKSRFSKRTTAGAIETDFIGGMVRDNPEINKQIAAMTALGRVGLPDDIGPMIAALLSGDNRWVNGQRIEVSGGMSL